MVEASEDVDEVIIDCVCVFFYNEQGKGGEHYRKKNKLRCAVANGKKRLVKLT